ncbi:hypothetical protein BKA69DRAFT_273513 [Paraphysoderma sedebokerense]|nr:hypothetical protein BKA69DRAFT_273513 [Paraphysoderma sedebokerense]
MRSRGCDNRSNALSRVYLAYTKLGKLSPRWCHLHFLNNKSLQRAHQIRQYLLSHLSHFKLPTKTSTNDTIAIRKAIVSGYFPHAAILQMDGSYKLIRGGETVWAHPNSVLFKRTPKCVVFHEIVESTKKFMKEVMAVEEEWLSELAPHFYEFKRAEPSAPR